MKPYNEYRLTFISQNVIKTIKDNRRDSFLKTELTPVTNKFIMKEFVSNDAELNPLLMPLIT